MLVIRNVKETNTLPENLKPLRSIYLYFSLNPGSLEYYKREVANQHDNLKSTSTIYLVYAAAEIIVACSRFQIIELVGHLLGIIDLIGPFDSFIVMGESIADKNSTGFLSHYF